MLLPGFIVQKAEEVVGLAQASSVSLSCAESCTGGLIGGALTSVASSSEVFQGGIISYSNEVKQRILGVSEEILKDYGAVSAECAASMADGAASVLQTDFAVSVTGIAGPGGGTKEKPVGTVWFGLHTPQGVQTKLCTFNGDRDAVRMNSVLQALDLLKISLKKDC